MLVRVCILFAQTKKLAGGRIVKIAKVTNIPV